MKTTTTRVLAADRWRLTALSRMKAGMDSPGQIAVAEQGWLKAHQWLLLRRLSQLGILALFLTGLVAGVWIVTGTLSASMTLDVLPLTDALLLAQSGLSGTLPAMSGLIGALIVLVFYALIGGRVFCSWVCHRHPLLGRFQYRDGSDQYRAVLHLLP